MVDFFSFFLNCEVFQILTQSQFCANVFNKLYLLTFTKHPVNTFPNHSSSIDCTIDCSSVKKWQSPISVMTGRENVRC